MTLRTVASRTSDQRAELREFSEACHHAVEAYVSRGLRRGDAFDKVARSMGTERRLVITGYWDYMRAHAPDPNAPTRSRARRRR